MNATVTQIKDYQEEKDERPAIYSTIEQASADLDTAMGEVVPFQQSETTEPSDEDIDRWWAEAVEQSRNIICSTERSMIGAMLITNLVDDLRICGISSSFILSAFQRGLDLR